MCRIDTSMHPPHLCIMKLPKTFSAIKISTMSLWWYPLNYFAFTTARFPRSGRNPWLRSQLWSPEYTPNSTATVHIAKQKTRSPYRRCKLQSTQTGRNGSWETSRHQKLNFATVIRTVHTPCCGIYCQSLRCPNPASKVTCMAHFLADQYFRWFFGFSCV